MDKTAPACPRCGFTEYVQNTLPRDANRHHCTNCNIHFGLKSNDAVTISDPLGIKIAQLAALRGAVRLESVGLKHSSRRSMRKRACQLLGIKTTTPNEEVRRILTLRIDYLQYCRRIDGQPDPVQWADLLSGKLEIISQKGEPWLL